MTRGLLTLSGGTSGRSRSGRSGPGLGRSGAPRPASSVHPLQYPGVPLRNEAGPAMSFGATARPSLARGSLPLLLDPRGAPAICGRVKAADHDPTAMAGTIVTVTSDRDRDMRTARFVRAIVGAAFLVMSIGPSAALGTAPSVAAGPSPGDGVYLERADADLNAAPPPRPLERRAGISIVGGTATTIQKWPWQVALTLSPSLNEGNARDRQICGGSLVTPRIVLSAAHCFFDSQDGPRPRNTRSSPAGRA